VIARATLTPVVALMPAHPFLPPAAVLPHDDVVTAPYNSVLALRELTDHADCVLPIHNEALLNICSKIEVRDVWFPLFSLFCGYFVCPTPSHVFVVHEQPTTGLV